MNDVQQRAIAAGFLHALQTTPALFSEWNAMPKDDYAAIGALIQKTMGLTTAPTQADIIAMATYIDSELSGQVDAVRKKHPDSPTHVGFISVMQQNS